MLFYVNKFKGYLLTSFEVQSLATERKVPYEVLEKALLESCFEAWGDELSTVSYIQPRATKLAADGSERYTQGYRYPIDHISSGLICFLANGQMNAISMDDTDFRIVLNERLWHTPNMAIYDSSLLQELSNL